MKEISGNYKNKLLIFAGNHGYPSLIPSVKNNRIKQKKKIFRLLAAYCIYNIK